MDNSFFDEIHGNFGFGLMRLPMLGGEVDKAQTCRMVDDFIAAGFNYFDTAHGYLGGKSETALRECVARRYPREAFLVTNKLTSPYFDRQEDIAPFLDEQLAACGVDYFDFYLMHAQDSEIYKKFRACKAYETALELKAQGKIRHFGISFHDKAAVLEQILTDFPETEVVQIQLNYVDWEDEAVEARKVYEVCEKFGKPAIIMEPVKGGSLVNLPAEAQAVLERLQEKTGKKQSSASYALRFAGSFRNVAMVLSGMSCTEQMTDNIGSMKDFVPLSAEESDAIDEVRRIFRSLNQIPCTTCRYCVHDSKCPKDIRIPELFSCYNAKKRFNDWNQNYYYENVATRGHGKASDCILCGRCESVCPQHLPIRKLLADVAREFDKKA